MCQSCTYNTTTVTTTCRKCLSGYYLFNNTCNACGVGCLVCSSFDPTVCSTCAPQMFVNSVNKCQKCPDGCHTCEKATGRCTSFIAGYIVRNNATVRCSPGCLTCDVNTP